jgi:hypothetical protein
LAVAAALAICGNEAKQRVAAIKVVIRNTYEIRVLFTWVRVFTV